jgi:hypothetical protein
MGASPRVASDRRTIEARDASDLRSYRTLLAQSDDLSDGGLAVVHLAQKK